MATVLSNLESKALIDREQSTVHARVVIAHLTRGGRAALKRADAAARDVERHVSEAFDPDEEAQLRELLERAIVALDTYGQDD